MTQVIKLAYDLKLGRSCRKLVTAREGGRQKPRTRGGAPKPPLGKESDPGCFARAGCSASEFSAWGGLPEVRGALGSLVGEGKDAAPRPGWAWRRRRREGGRESAVELEGKEASEEMWGRGSWAVGGSGCGDGGKEQRERDWVWGRESDAGGKVSRKARERSVVGCPVPFCLPPVAAHGDHSLPPAEFLCF